MLRLWPPHRDGERCPPELTGAELVDVYSYPDALSRPWVRINFVSSVDGAATVGGFSAGLSSRADRQVFGLLRELADVVLVGAGTARTEGYRGTRSSAQLRSRRRMRGQAEVAPIAVVTASAAIEPDAPLLTDTLVPPLVLTTSAAPEHRRERLAAAGAEVTVVGAEWVQPTPLLAELDRRGLRRVLCEGGPRLLGDLVAGDAVDEMCLTLAPCLAGGGAPRIVAGATPAAAQGLHTASVLAEDCVLLLRYLRHAEQDVPRSRG